MKDDSGAVRMRPEEFWQQSPIGGTPKRYYTLPVAQRPRSFKVGRERIYTETSEQWLARLEREQGGVAA